MYYKDKADKQTSVSLGKKKQFHKCRKDPIATFPQDPPPVLLTQEGVTSAQGK